MLRVRDLTVHFDTPEGVLRAINHVSFDVDAGEVVGIVGESGSGKSVTVQTILGLIPTPPARIVGGSVTYEGTELLGQSNRVLRQVRGKEIGIVFQEPFASLNPLLRVGRQVGEAIRTHNPEVTKAEALDRAIGLLELVRVPDAHLRVNDYPHQFSGGMAQRVAIAIAIANQPRLLIADEPTTALDVTIQAQIMETLRLVQRETGAAMILITHDLAMIAEVADRVLVMYGGSLMESSPVSDVFHRPVHPYTVGLLASIPRLDRKEPRLSAIPGQPPNMATANRGCPFASRCYLSEGRSRCVDERPVLRTISTGRSVACHFAEEVETPTAGSN